MGVPDGAAFSQSFAAWAEANAKPYFTPDTPRAAIDWTLRTMERTSLQAAIALSRIQTSSDFRNEDLAAIVHPGIVPVRDIAVHDRPRALDIDQTPDP